MQHIVTYFYLSLKNQLVFLLLSLIDYSFSPNQGEDVECNWISSHKKVMSKKIRSVNSRLVDIEESKTKITHNIIRKKNIKPFIPFHLLGQVKSL